MGTTNFGTQTISFDFQEPGKSENFNKLNHKILEPGIYEGGLLSYADATHINLAPFLAYIEDTETEVSVRVETAEVVNLLVASSAPYCILRFNWSNTTNNYADVLMTSYANIEADDLIIGRAIYDVTTLETFFDYSRKSVPVIATDTAEKLEFIVRPQEPYDKTVSIQGGIINNGVESITVPSGSSPTISDTTLGRTDIVYMLPSGSFAVIEGEDSASPVTPDYGTGYVLCEIHRGAGKTYITGADITMVSEDKFAMDNLLRADVDNKVATQKTTTIPKNITKAYENLIKNGNNLTLPDWTDSDSSRQLSDQSINGSYFTKVVNSAVAWAGYATQPLYETFTSSILSGSVTIREGFTTGNLARFGFFNTTAGAFACQIDIDFNTSSVVATTGNLLKTEWYDEETVKVYFQTITLPNLTDDLKVTCYASPSAPSQEYTYFTEVQLLDDSTSALFPFVDGSKEVDIIEEAFTMPDKFTIDTIIEPKFAYDTGIYHRVLNWNDGTSTGLRVYFLTDTDNLVLQWEDGGTAYSLYGPVHDDGTSYTNINQRLRITASLDLVSGTTSGSRFIIAPLESGILQEDNIWNGIPNIKTSSFPTLSIGHEQESNYADSEYEYLRVYEGLLVGDIEESSDVDTLLMSQTLLFDANIDEFKETKIEAGTPVAVALEGIVQDVKTGVAIQDKAITNRHLDDSLAEKASFVNQDVKDTASPAFAGISVEGISYTTEAYNITHIGNSYSFGWSTTYSARPDITALNSTDIAIYDYLSNLLRTVRWDGENWAQVGNSKTITSARSTISALDSTHIAIAIDNLPGRLSTYEWDGTDWTQIGNELAMGAPRAVCALTSSTVFVCESSGNTFRTYEWDGTDWTQIGNSTAVAATLSSSYSCRMSDTRIFVIAATTKCYYLDWDGTDWTTLGLISLSIGAAGLHAVNENTLFIGGNTSNKIELLRIIDNEPAYANPTISIAEASATGGGGQGMTRLIGTNTFVHVSDGNGLLSSYRVGTMLAALY